MKRRREQWSLSRYGPDCFSITRMPPTICGLKCFHRMPAFRRRQTPAFSLALHDKFGYQIEHIVAPVEAEEEYEGDLEDNTLVNSLVHIYCVQDDILLDVRGATDNEQLFMSEFSDWVDGNESYFSFDAGECREFVESSMTAQEYAAYYNAAIEMIERHPEWYQLQ